MLADVGDQSEVVVQAMVVITTERLNVIYSRSGARGSSMVRAFTHGAMGRRIDPSWWTH